MEGLIGHHQRVGGVALERNTPGLWNVGYASILFWDGREESLEEQSLVPLMHRDEMGATDSELLIDELAEIDSYADRFESAFDNGLTIENVQRALAAFQRTLISDDSPFDRYAAGNVNALTPQQRRGLALFRSGATRCFECHAAPTFSTVSLRVVGVPDDDPGGGAVSDVVPDGAFKVPSLRNVALTAPYFHDGSAETLREAVSVMGSTQLGRTFTEEEVGQIEAFLESLTGEFPLVTFPRLPR